MVSRKKFIQKNSEEDLAGFQTTIPAHAFNRSLIQRISFLVLVLNLQKKERQLLVSRNKVFNNKLVLKIR